MNEVNLLKVARALREAGDGPGFTMSCFHSCGTPGCALGHYAARSDLQGEFKLSGERFLVSVDGKRDEENICNCSICMETWPGLAYNGSVVREHFGLTYEQANELFSSHGCSNAVTATEAAAYIEAFVERHREVKDEGVRASVSLPEAAEPVAAV